MNRLLRWNATAALALLGATAILPAEAQLLDPSSFYGTLGYSDISGRELTNGAVTGRLGVRFWNYLGVEGELSVGINESHFLYSPPCKAPICTVPIFHMGSRLQNAEGIYAVGYLPLSPNADLFVRGGYGFANYSTSVSFFNGFSDQGLAFGGGGQYYFDGANGVRFDYTRQEDQSTDFVGQRAFGSGVNVWSIAYTRKF